VIPTPAPAAGAAPALAPAASLRVQPGESLPVSRAGGGPTAWQIRSVADARISALAVGMAGKICDDSESLAVRYGAHIKVQLEVQHQTDDDNLSCVVRLSKPKPETAIEGGPGGY
jgi:hypothetical protein